MYFRQKMSSFFCIKLSSMTHILLLFLFMRFWASGVCTPKKSDSKIESINLWMSIFDGIFLKALKTYLYQGRNFRANMWQFISSLNRPKGESRDGGNKKIKHDMFVFWKTSYKRLKIDLFQRYPFQFDAFFLKPVQERCRKLGLHHSLSSQKMLHNYLLIY